MRPALKKIVSASLLIVCCLAMQSCSAREEKEVLPQEVKVMIGMKIPPKEKGRGGDIPKLTLLNGALVKEDDSGNTLAYEEGLVSGKWPVFFVERILKDKTTEILDAQLLPENLIQWRFVGENVVFLKNRYQLSNHCQKQPVDSKIIFGLVKARRGKSDCGHFSQHVDRAWQIDPLTGQISTVPAKGLQCYYLEISEC